MYIFIDILKIIFLCMYENNVHMYVFNAMCVCMIK